MLAQIFSGLGIEIISVLITGLFGLLVALVSIISPLITTHLNHKFELKLIDIKDKERKNAIISAFLSELAYTASINPHNFKGFSKESLAVVQYLPKEHINLLLTLISELETKHKDLIPEAQTTFGDLWYDNERYYIETKSDMPVSYYQIVSIFVDALKEHKTR